MPPAISAAVGKVATRSFMRDANTRLLLHTVRRAELISHGQIVQQTQLSPAAVTKIVNRLKGRNLICEVGQAASPGKGRKPTLLQFNPDAACVIGAGILADETRIALCDLCGNIKHQEIFPTHTHDGPEAMLLDLADRIEALCDQQQCHTGQLLGIGIAIEGIVDSNDRRLIYSSRFGWRNVDIGSIISDRLNTQVLTDSDGACMAMAEYHFGAGKHLTHMILVDMDDGIGTIELQDGRIRRGHHHMAGETGHTLAVENGLPCRCGKNGCLETVAGGWGIIANVRRRMQQGAHTQLTDDIFTCTTRQALRAILDAADRGDELAADVIHQAVQHLARAIASVINYADPQAVLLCGCLIEEANEHVPARIRHAVREHVVGSDVRDIQIEPARMAHQGLVTGAAALIYDESFRVPLQ